MRFISEHTGIPRATVHRYSSGVPSETPAYVTGKDGKSYRAVRPTDKSHDASESVVERALDDLALVGVNRERLSAMIEAALIDEAARAHWVARFGFAIGDLDALRDFARTADPGDVVEAWRTIKIYCGEGVP